MNCNIKSAYSFNHFNYDLMHFAINQFKANNLNLLYYLESLLDFITVKLTVSEYPIYFIISLSLALLNINSIS
jgi:hypothetical protein